MVYGLVFIAILGAFFHLLFIAPFAKMRKSIMESDNGSEHSHED